MSSVSPDTPVTLEIACQTCGAKILLEEHLRTAECPYCGSPAIVERPPSPDRPDPVFALAFVVGRERANALLRSWLARRGPFAPSALKRGVVDHTRGIYLPAYLYSARAESSFQAEIGEDYTVTETYTTTDSDGNTVTRTRTRTETEWRTLEGKHTTYVSDVVVTASRGVENAELEAVEPFDLRALRRYEPAILSGWIAEEPSLTRGECLRAAHDESAEKIGRALEEFMPGDSHRNLRFETRLLEPSADLALLPVWVFVVRHAEDKEPIRILINGQTGAVGGRTPRSAVKITVTIVVLLALLVAIILAVQV